jgi:AbrB family looped-hinge helix DNA binding protein
MPDNVKIAPMVQIFRSKLTGAGRIVIPVAIRERLGLTDGTELVMSVDEKGIRLRPLDMAIVRAQDYFSSLGPSNSLPSEELMRERRQAAKNEDE